MNYFGRMIISKLNYILVFLMFFSLTNCKPKDIEPSEKKYCIIQLQHKIGNKSLLKGALDYRNEAGEIFSINKLEYYLSNFIFNNKSILSDSNVFYVNSFKTNTHFFHLNLEQGDENQLIESINFNLGLAENQNNSSFLPNTTDNVNMIWPDQMGGGYHFLKLEGNYLNQNDTLGYALHLGKDKNLISIQVDELSLQINNSDTIKIQVDLLEFFKNPEVYSINKGQHTMYSDSLMQIIKTNAWSVFSLNP